MYEVRSIYVLKHAEIVRMARELAESGEPLAHGFAPGSAQAHAFENHYTARRAELDALEAERV